MNTITRTSTSLIIAGLLGFAVNAYGQPLDACNVVYGVHDDLLSDSQLITLDPAQDFAIAALGPIHRDLDIEAIDLNTLQELYVAAGDDTSKPGHLYKVDVTTGALTAIGSTGFAEIDGISFNPVDNSLWGWAQGVGLILIDPATAESQVVSPASGEFEDLTWGLNGEILYVAENDHAGNPDRGGDEAAQHTLWSYNINSGEVLTLCQNAISALVGNNEIEALETLPDGSLMLGYHNSTDQPMLAALDPQSCAVTLQENLYQVSASTPFEDIEALAACIQPANPICIEDDLSIPWQYVADHANDVTGAAALEVSGVAYKEEAGRITIAINANMGLDGMYHKKAKDKNVGFADFVMDFDSVTYAVKFATDNDSSVTQQGLYRNVVFKDVTKDNVGWSKLQKIQKYVKDKYTLGDIANYTYFNWNKSRSVPMSIKSGTLVTDANFTMLDATELAAMGLDFTAGLGRAEFPYTFGFSFDRTADMPGDFLGYFFTECINDGVAIMTRAPMCPVDPQ